ncbi:MAG TPA: right-handed parallel beta-helix repeat-containing protein, partial [Polyangiaceae bacterium]|nr:right-handed parallel beta-helix repeat-containing protein [Polyangiaceae bacterium]
SVWSPVKIWGTCPREVEVGTIAIHAAGTEVHAVALRGVTVAGVRDVVLDKLWIHDAPDRGVEASELGGSASATLRDSLVEGATGLAAFVYGSDMLIERSQLRETRDYPAAYVSLGVGALDSNESGMPSHLEIRHSVIETSPSTGVFAYGSELVMEASVVRDIRPDLAGSTGMGIFVQRDPMTGTPAKGSILSSVIERTFTVGFQVVGAEADMRFSSVRDTEWAQDPSLGRGAFVAGDDVQRASVHVYGALFERHRDVGIYVNAGDLALEGVIARDTYANMDGQLGVGVGVDVTTSRGALAMKGSVVERNETGGIYVSGADAVIESSVVHDSLLEPLTGEFGRGLQVQAKWSTGERANVTVRDALIERNREVGIFVGASDVTVERSVIRDTVASDAGLFGDGIAVLGQDAATSANVSETRIENSARAGILAYSGKVSLGASVLECNPIHLDGETVTTPYEFVVTSENVCGCKGETVTCKVLSSMLAPPAPLDH